jgi:hypothetical protein
LWDEVQGTAHEDMGESAKHQIGIKKAQRFTRCAFLLRFVGLPTSIALLTTGLFFAGTSLIDT